MNAKLQKYNYFFRITVIFILSLPVLYGCGSNNDQEYPDVSHIEVDFKVDRLEQELFSLKSKEAVKKFLDTHEVLKKSFLEIDQYPHDSILVNRLFKLIRDPYIDTLYRETRQKFKDFSEIETSFRNAFRHIKYYYPDFTAPEIKTMVTGFGRDLFVSDSVIIIGLDFYLGKGATYRPLDIPGYILKRYAEEYIVPSCILLLSNKYNATDYSDKSMLAEMIYYGKAYYFTKNMLPTTHDSLLIGYSGQELLEVNDHQNIVWAHFIENQLLYETNHFIKKKYMQERPKTLEIGNRAPGRIGVWLGWEIVREYMEENPETSLPELMKMTDVQNIFRQSGYKPERP